MFVSPFYQQRTDLKSCKNYCDCQVSFAAWRIPIWRHYDSCGGYWQVDTVPKVCKWRAYEIRYLSNISYCPIRFLSYSHIEIGYWFDRDLPLLNQYQEFLTLENLVAMEIKQTYYRLGFFDAVPKTPKKFIGSSVENYD